MPAPSVVRGSCGRGLQSVDRRDARVPRNPERQQWKSISVLQGCDARGDEAL